MQGIAGLILLNELMPEDVKFDVNKKITKAEYNKKLTEFAKKHPREYSKNITKIARLGEKMAYYLGSNVGMDDLSVDKKKVNSFINSIDTKMKKAKTDDQKRNILLNGLKKAPSVAENASSNSNEMLQQVKSGARGKPVQFARMSVGPIYAVDMEQLPKPTLIRNSFSTGLASHEYFNVASHGRFASVQSNNATSEPGALGKVIVANTDDQTITMKDCHTKNGIFYNSNDRHILGRYEAGTDRLIDEAYFKELQKKAKQVKVRSPITCQAPKGICAKCYGLKANGRIPVIGDDVGIESSQTIGQILVQMTLSTKHSTIGKTSSGKLTGVDGFKTIANSPSSFSGAATVSTVNGTVSSIIDAPQGGKYIFIGSKRFHSDPGRKIIVKVGQKVHKGDSLTDGVVTPKKILETRSINEAREHESIMLHSLFKDSTGKDLQKKHFELLSRGHLSLGESKDGTIDSMNSLMSKYPRMSMTEMVSDKIKGKYLAEDVGSLSKGLEIDDRVIKILKKWMIHRVKTTKERPPVKPIFKSLEQRPSFGRGLYSKLNYRNLSKAIKDETSYGRAYNIRNSSSNREKHTAGML